ncbi:MAG: TonB-dependent receptor [Saprospiraceae bacterium]|nr:TonB-dependent receptor [Saprospiraceae bacterium]
MQSYSTTWLLVLFCICSINSFAQNSNNIDQVTVKGYVVDTNTNAPLEFATIAVYDLPDSSLIGGGLTELDGSFEVQVNRGNNFIQIEYISYTTMTINPIPTPEGGNIVDLGDIPMEAESALLDDIEIVAERSETVFALDKKIFTVGKDLANRGGTAEEILDNVPSVTVDIDGNVSLRGNSGVRIFINGRPSSLAGAGNSNGLRSLSANLIESIEVITNPSARYEAEGTAGIINIILKKNQSGGLNGAIDVNGGYPARAGASANLNYRKDKLNWFVNYGLNYNSNPGGGYTVQDQLLSNAAEFENRQFSIQNRNQTRTGLSNSYRFGADYFFSENEQLTASFLYRRSDEDNFSTLEYRDYFGNVNGMGIDPLWNQSIDFLKSQDYDNIENQLAEEDLRDIIVRTDDETEDEKNLEYSLNYKKEFSSREHTLNATVQFREKSETEGSFFENTDVINDETVLLQRSNNSEGDETWFIKMDYVHPLGKDHKWETGILTTFRQIRNDFLVEENTENGWMSLPGLSNNFVYDEDVQAAYFIYGNTIKKFSYQMGIRGEHTLINTQLLQTEDNSENKRDFFSLFPSGTLSYNFSEKTAVQLSYSRRIRRPRFWDLNPFFTFSDNRNFFSGNPSVNPQFTDSYELGQIQYWDDVSLSGSIFYRQTQSSIQRINTVDNFAGTTLRVPINLGTEHDIGLDVSFAYSGLKWLRIDGNFNLFRNELTLDSNETDAAVFDYYTTVREYEGSFSEFGNQYAYQLQPFSNITWNGRLTARFTFFDSDLQIRTNYRAPRASAQGQRRGIASVDLGWSKDFLNNKLTVTLSVRDLFNSRKRNGFTLLDDFFQQSEFQWRSRYSNLSFSYRINQKKNNRGRSNSDRGDFEGGEF